MRTLADGRGESHSIGMQSALDEELELLGRRHRFGEICKAVAALRLRACEFQSGSAIWITVRN
jgi:coproporphyrinogen III oxidase-like Fe-S oxidoreductase